MAHFNRTLIRLRAAAGYKTAYSFYSSNGGRRTFPFSYVSYVGIERGKSLPKPTWLSRIIAGLRIGISENDRAALMTAYLRDLSEQSAVFDDLFAPYLAKPVEPAHRTAVKALMGDSAYHLTAEQFQSSLESAPMFWSVLLLSCHAKPLEPEAIAGMTGLPLTGIEGALKKLAKLGLVKRMASGSYKSPLTGRNSTAPVDADSQRAKEKLRAYALEMARSRGRIALDACVTLRLEASTAAEVARSLTDVLEHTAARAVQEGGSDTGIYFVSVGVAKSLSC